MLGSLPNGGFPSDLLILKCHYTLLSKSKRFGLITAELLSDKGQQSDGLGAIQVCIIISSLIIGFFQSRYYRTCQLSRGGQWIAEATSGSGWTGRIDVSSANIVVVVAVVVKSAVGKFGVSREYKIGPKTLSCGTPYFTQPQDCSLSKEQKILTLCMYLALKTKQKKCLPILHMYALPPVYYAHTLQTRNTRYSVTIRR